MLYKSLASDFMINVIHFPLVRYIQRTQQGTRMASGPFKKAESSAMEEVSGIIPPAELTPEVNSRAPGGSRLKGKNILVVSAIPLSRQGTGWGVAYVVLFLLSGESSFITAQEIIEDGGTLGTGGKRAKTPNTFTEM
jgi:hypothetical protein